MLENQPQPKAAPDEGQCRMCSRDESMFWFWWQLKMKRKRHFAFVLCESEDWTEDLSPKKKGWPTAARVYLYCKQNWIMTESPQFDTLQPEILVKIFNYLSKVRYRNLLHLLYCKDSDSTLPSAPMLQVRLFNISIHLPKTDLPIVLRYLYNVGSHPWLWRGIKISKNRFSEVNRTYILKWRSK